GECVWRFGWYHYKISRAKIDMTISSAEFVKSAFDRTHWTTDGLSEIAFLGRSNVGKSSLLNSLLQRKGLARTSNTPGRTQSINYFLINESFYFVDLPGYGYARVSKSIRADWGIMARDYLSERNELVLCIQLVDSRHSPTELDLQLNDWLIFNNKDHIVVATKSDKSSNNQLHKQLNEIKKLLPESKILSYSASTGKGRDALWDEIESAIKKI
ncbi:MAG: ribosome biogenesis GTP-binding protein YihA/YsxC, partial [Pyrinomonadaceae bacterium]